LLWDRNLPELCPKFEDEYLPEKFSAEMKFCKIDPSANSSATGGSSSASSGPGGLGELHKATSQISITQLSGINVNIR
jgi:hypothetical protein